MCEELFPDAVRILDFYHLSENVNDYAKALYPVDELNRKRWVEEMSETILIGKVDRAIEIINENKPKKLQHGLINLSTYINNNRERIDYPTYKAAGYYIGSGPIEKVPIKLVIQQRMKQAGMRWSVEGGQYIAALRVKHESDLWEDVENIIYVS